MSNHQVIVRADSSSVIGNGHVSRCLNLANELKKKSVNTVFLSEYMQEPIRLLIKSNGHELIKINSETDVDQLVGLAEKLNPKWVIIDRQKFDEPYQTTIKRHGHKLLCINDIVGEYRFNTDMLLNQNIHADKFYYEGRVNEDAELILGPSYALLNDRYSEYPHYPKRKNDVERLLVTFGGSDTTDACLLSLEAINLIEDIHYEVTVIAPGCDKEKLSKTIKGGVHSINIIDQHVDNMECHINSNDMSIIAGGITTWEMSCMGMPMIIMTLAENQWLNAKKMSAQGLARYVGDIKSVSTIGLSDTIHELSVDSKTRNEMSDNLVKLVDGKGCARVVEKMGF